MTATAPMRREEQPLVDLLETELADELDGIPRHLWERALGSPAREFLERPGKQFRARLVSAAWVLGGGAHHDMPAALAHVVELLHAGSLIVDDIEDESDTRRGGPALHKVFGVPLALNTGNWLYFWPLVLIDRLPMSELRRAALAREAALAVERCHRGQALDLALPITALEQAEVPRVVRTTTRLKTGALMELAGALGGIAAGADEHHVAALRRFGRGLGEGLQMLDDLSGLTSPTRANKAAEDLVNERPTWPWAWLASASGPGVFQNYCDHLRRVSTGIEPAAPLASALRDAVAESGRQRVHASLHLCLADLENTFGTTPIVGGLRDEITRLEKSYE